jgi:hypothetical protein
MLSPCALHEPSGGFDRSYSTAFGQDEFSELGTKVRGPSIGCVNYCSGSHFSTRGGDSDPAVAVFV